MKEKIKLQSFFALKKAVRYNILIKRTKVVFDTQMISQKILRLEYFFYRVKKIQKSNAGFTQDFKTQKLGDLRVFEEKTHCF